ncbi:MAG: helix-turn-helix domain-containing protein [Lachnospiraceae bacterium]|nr:helix-turn-helix domain-containing protein [Lachnospiraceae bacterium]
MEDRNPAPVSIRRVLDREMCDKLVQSSSLTIGRNVLITDEKGYVLASNMEGRAETLHEASLEVIRTGRTAYHDEKAAAKLKGTRPGMTIPLLVDGQVIGTIGVSGEPQEVSRYAALVQQMTQIFMSFQSRQQTYARVDYQQQNLLREIISFDERIRNASEIYNLAYELGLDLKLARTAALIAKAREPGNLTEDSGSKESLLAIINRIFPDKQDFICQQNDGTYVVFTCLKEGVKEKAHILSKCKQMEEAYRKNGQLQIGIGSPAGTLEELRKSYEDAGFALRVIRTGVRKEKCLAAEDLQLEVMAASLPEEVCRAVRESFPEDLFRVHRSQDSMELIDNWCRLGFHFTATAEALHIHKSTLIYRFQRIKDLYGLDLYDYQKVIPLFLLGIRRRLL